MAVQEEILVLNPLEDMAKLKALASEQRVQMLDLLRKGEMNINDISDALKLPQSTVATHIAILENAGLVLTKSVKARKGVQKLCRTAFQELLVRFPEGQPALRNYEEIEMPVGLFTDCQVAPPCGLCSSAGIIGMLDMPDSFLHPDRMNAGLLWCSGGGAFEYKFPNSASYDGKAPVRLEADIELCSKASGEGGDHRSDITVWINGVEIGTWICPDDFGDRRGKYTPDWRPLGESQYGLLKHFSVTVHGSYVDGVKISDQRLDDLRLDESHFIRLRVGVKELTEHRGGITIFGRGFGNYDRGIILRTYFS